MPRHSLAALPAQSEIDKILDLMQCHSRREHHVIGAIDPAQTKADFRAYGVADKDGNLYLDRFEAMVTTNCAQLNSEGNFALQARDEAA